MERKNSIVTFHCLRATVVELRQANRKPSCYQPSQEFTLSLRASRINAFQISNIKAAPPVSASILLLFRPGLFFRFSQCRSSHVLSPFMNVSWWQAAEQKSKERNQNVEKGVKYDKSADSLSLVSLILISRHKYWFASSAHRPISMRKTFAWRKFISSGYEAGIAEDKLLLYVCDINIHIV